MKSQYGKRHNRHVDVGVWSQPARGYRNPHSGDFIKAAKPGKVVIQAPNCPSITLHLWHKSTKGWGGFSRGDVITKPTLPEKPRTLSISELKRPKQTKGKKRKYKWNKNYGFGK